MKEKEFQTKVTSWLRRHDILFVKIHGGKIYEPKGRPAYMGGNDYFGYFYPLQLKSGFSDLIVFDRGETFFIEIKQDGNYLQKNQKETFYQLNDSGFNEHCYVLKPKHWEAIKFNYKVTKSLKSTLLMTLGVNDWDPKTKHHK